MYQCRYMIQDMKGIEWLLSPNQYDDPFYAFVDQDDIAGFDGVGPTQVINLESGESLRIVDRRFNWNCGTEKYESSDPNILNTFYLYPRSEIRIIK